MGKLLASLALVGAIVAPAGASAQDMNLGGVIRTMSLYAAISEYCPAFMRVDKVAADKSFTAAGLVAKKVGGSLDLTSLVGAELNRRAREVEATGAEFWCIYQRDRPVNRSVFPKNR